MKTDSSLEFRDMVETKVKELAENIGYRLRDAFQEVGGDLNDISLQDNAKLILLPALQLDALSRNLDTHKFWKHKRILHNWQRKGPIRKLGLP